MNPGNIAIVIPLYNERDNVGKLFERFRGLARSTSITWHLIFVDDGSTDGTVDQLVQTFSQRVDHLTCRVLELSRHFGKEAALAVGFETADCDLVATLDADLQDPPELLPEMLDTLLREKADVVCGQRVVRAGESSVRRAGAYVYYRIARYVSDVSPDVDVGDFRLMTRQVVESLNRFPERSRFMKSIYAAAGFRRVIFPYQRHARAGGRAKLSVIPLVDLALDGITGLSIKPLRVSAYLSLAVFFSALCYAIFIAVRVLVWGRDVPGYASLIVVILVMNGLLFAMLGLFGEYLGRILIETKERPIAIVRRSIDLSVKSP
jgi:polyisoprenyl-phosphate glycosyltransferase